MAGQGSLRFLIGKHKSMIYPTNQWQGREMFFPSLLANTNSPVSCRENLLTWKGKVGKSRQKKLAVQNNFYDTKFLAFHKASQHIIKKIGAAICSLKKNATGQKCLTHEFSDTLAYLWGSSPAVAILSTINKRGIGNLVG